MFVTGLILMLVFFGMLGSTLDGFASFGKSERTKVEDQTVLHLKLDQDIVERGGSNDDLNIDLSGLGGESSMGLNEILKHLDRAKDDERIEGLFLDLSYIPAGSATLKEVRDKILDFKDGSDKWVICFAEYMTQGTYYVASAADELYLYPEGAMDLSGFNVERMFFKGLLDKLGVEMQVIRGSDNSFKSAVEPFIRKDMSDSAKTQTIAWVGDLWNVQLQEISASRGISVANLNMYCDSLMIKNAEDALEYKLVDGLKYRDEILALLEEKVELEEDEELELLAFGKYFDARDKRKKDRDDDDDDEEEDDEDEDSKIAVIYAEGEIVSGDASSSISSDVFAKAIKQAREDSTVKAIVLRVNSPGGSALASDVIWREVMLAKAEKPFIASMGNVAASGGYYISCAADQIFAMDNTITGSIGVFGMLPNMGTFYDEKLGITFDGVKTNEYSDLGTTSRALTEKEFNVIQEIVDDIYDEFTQRVADGRGMAQSDVKKIAKGRVWSGKQALEIGLVDQIGGVQDAIDYAAEQAGLDDDYELASYPKRKDKWEQILADLGIDVSEQVLIDQFGGNKELYEQFKAIQKMKSMEGVQARLPFIYTIK